MEYKCNVMWAVIRRSFCRVGPLPWCCSLLSSLLLLDVDYFNCPSLDLPARLSFFSSADIISFFPFFPNLYILSLRLTNIPAFLSFLPLHHYTIATSSTPTTVPLYN